MYITHMLSKNNVNQMGEGIFWKGHFAVASCCTLSLLARSIAQIKQEHWTRQFLGYRYLNANYTCNTCRELLGSVNFQKVSMGAVFPTVLCIRFRNHLTHWKKGRYMTTTPKEGVRDRLFKNRRSIFKRSFFQYQIFSGSKSECLVEQYRWLMQHALGNEALLAWKLHIRHGVCSRFTQVGWFYCAVCPFSKDRRPNVKLLTVFFCFSSRQQKSDPILARTLHVTPCRQAFKIGRLEWQHIYVFYISLSCTIGLKTKGLILNSPHHAIVEVFNGAVQHGEILQTPCKGDFTPKGNRPWWKGHHTMDSISTMSLKANYITQIARWQTAFATHLFDSIDYKYYI